MEVTNIKVVTLHGTQLPADLIKLMVDNRIREYGENTKDFENKERNSTFFFLYEGDMIKAFAMLKPVTLYYHDKEFAIMGLANVMCLEKSKGYGTKIMSAVTKYLDQNNIAAIGNTWKYNFDFYKKCGFTFLPNLIERMIYITPEGKHEKTERVDYDMFYYNPIGSIDNVVSSTDEIIIKVPFW